MNRDGQFPKTEFKYDTTYIGTKGELGKTSGLSFSQIIPCELKSIQINMYETMMALENNDVNKFCNGIKYELNPQTYNGGTCNYCSNSFNTFPNCT
jgi:hypothetical protein